MKKPNTIFFSQVDKVTSRQGELYKNYRKKILMFDHLKKQSKYYMNQLGDVEDGLAGGNSQKIDDIVSDLIKPIENFNKEIDTALKAFENAFDELAIDLRALINHYNDPETQLPQLQIVKRSMKHLRLLVERLKNEVISLQLMNNILFSLYDELSDAKLVYKKKLSSMLTFLLKLELETKDYIHKLESVQ